MKDLIKDDYLMYIHLSVWNVSLINKKYIELAVESFNSLEITGFSGHLRGSCVRRLQFKINQLTREIYFCETVSN